MQYFITHVFITSIYTVFSIADKKYLCSISKYCDTMVLSDVISSHISTFISQMNRS